jgi:beta-lactamase regulating signal transducer with metallopeptidase domain
MATPARIARARALQSDRYTWERTVEDLQTWANHAAPWACLLWLVGVACLSSSMAAGVVHLNRLKKTGTEPTDNPLDRMLECLAQRMGVSRAVRLLVSESIEVPSVFGWLRPVVLLPATALTGFTPAQLEALLAHELAHLRRYDYVANWIQNVIETLLFYHPAVWWISRRVRVEREYCCDEMAVATCGDPLLYARALTAMETLRRPRPRMALSARGGFLLGRIRRVLEPVRPTRRGFGGTAGLVALAVMVGVALALYAPFARAQNEPATLKFPAKHSVGLLLVRDKDGPFTATGEGEGWHAYAQAQGKVVIPEDVELMLRVTPSERVNLWSLRELDAGTLTRLDVSNCNLQDRDLAFIAGLSGLKGLSLNGNPQLTPEGWKRLGHLKSLVWLGIEQTAIADTPEHRLYPLVDLEYLNAFQSNFDDVSAESLKESISLKWLGLDSTKITGAALEHLHNLTALEGLTLENTAIDDAGVAHIKELTGLKLLVLKRTPIDDAAVASLASLPHLETLDLSGTRITEACLDTLLTFPSLRTVNLEETSIPPDRAEAFKQTLARHSGNMQTAAAFLDEELHARKEYYARTLEQERNAIGRVPGSDTAVKMQ